MEVGPIAYSVFRRSVLMAFIHSLDQVNKGLGTNLSREEYDARVQRVWGAEALLALMRLTPNASAVDSPMLDAEGDDSTGRRETPMQPDRNQTGVPTNPTENYQESVMAVAHEHLVGGGSLGGHNGTAMLAAAMSGDIQAPMFSTMVSQEGDHGAGSFSETPPPGMVMLATAATQGFQGQMLSTNTVTQNEEGHAALFPNSITRTMEHGASGLSFIDPRLLLNSENEHPL
jgi:hypothetical protein